jgi:hypothetical protein
MFFLRNLRLDDAHDSHRCVIIEAEGCVSQSDTMKRQRRLQKAMAVKGDCIVAKDMDDYDALTPCT